MVRGLLIVQGMLLNDCSNTLHHIQLRTTVLTRLPGRGGYRDAGMFTQIGSLSDEGVRLTRSVIDPHLALARESDR